MGESREPRHLSLVREQTGFNAPAERSTSLLKERLKIIKGGLIRAQFDRPTGESDVRDITPRLDPTDVSRFDAYNLSKGDPLPLQFSRAEQIVLQLEDNVDEIPREGGFLMAKGYKDGKTPVVQIGRRGKEGPEAWTLAFADPRAYEEFCDLWFAGNFSPDMILQTLDEVTQDRSVVLEQAIPQPKIEKLSYPPLSVSASIVKDGRVDETDQSHKDRVAILQKKFETFGKRMTPGQIYCYVEGIKADHREHMEQDQEVWITAGGQGILKGNPSEIFTIGMKVHAFEVPAIAKMLLSGDIYAEGMLEQLLAYQDQLPPSFAIPVGISPRKHLKVEGTDQLDGILKRDILHEMQYGRQLQQPPVWRVREPAAAADEPTVISAPVRVVTTGARSRSAPPQGQTSGRHALRDAA